MLIGQESGVDRFAVSLAFEAFDELLAPFRGVVGRNQARALLDSRIESITQLVKARQRVADLKEQLAEAERDDKRAYVRATKDGWSTEELKKLGLEPGAVSRRRKTSSAETASQTSTPPHGDILDTATTQP